MTIPQTTPIITQFPYAVKTRTRPEGMLGIFHVASAECYIDIVCRLWLHQDNEMRVCVLPEIFVNSQNSW
jgi:hypothetical protein